MSEQAFRYVIVGGGLAGGHAIEGIRELDKEGSILLVSNEEYLPYDRPPLSKKLWFGKKTVEEIFVHDREFYGNNGVIVQLSRNIASLDAGNHCVTDGDGNVYSYEKLLLATGGVPRKLSIPGGDLDGVCYYRYLRDYERIRRDASDGKSAVVIGGGFIGSEMAAALNINKLHVTMIFPEPYLLHRILPEDLGRSILQNYINCGVNILSEDAPTAIEKRGDKFVTSTRNGRQVESDIVIVGIGIAPAVELAENAGLTVTDGMDVNDYLQTSNPNIYAAGDNAFFPYHPLGGKRRVEHWDNAVEQGKQAGRNMAGANEQYTHMPYFFSDLFDFGFEGVGDTDSRLEIFEDWQKENDTGVIYYLRDGRVVGAMMCNVWDKVPEARELIRAGKRISHSGEGIPMPHDP